jgi:hypothetical protein
MKLAAALNKDGVYHLEFIIEQYTTLVPEHFGNLKGHAHQAI